MAVGKYSPVCPHANTNYEFKYNAHREIAPDFIKGQMDYDEKIHFANYDEEGFDRYGYSAFDADGNYVGIGEGVDRLGKTESEYLAEYTSAFNEGEFANNG